MRRKDIPSTADIRLTILDARRNQLPERRIEASTVITERFLRSREFFAAKRIACYFPMVDEVDTRAIFERGWRAQKQLFAPVIRRSRIMQFREVLRESTLKKNEYGIWEPVDGTPIDPRMLDVVVTPLVAFDVHGNRIGMGGGYYDRCFSFLRHRKQLLQPKLIGLAFDCQKIEKIAPNPWDIPLYRVYSD